MKITGIDIGDYRQFKNIKFDFTYPADHPKAGQPLEKVCFIGQSGTGKTTLLNVIWELFRVTNDAYQSYDKRSIVEHIHNSYNSFYYPNSISIKSKNRSVIYNISEEIEDNNLLRISNVVQWLIKTELKEIYDSIEKTCIYIKDSIAREADAFLFDQKSQPQTFSDFIKTDTQVEKEKNLRDKRINEAGSKKVVSLGDMQSISIWQYLLKNVDEYDEDTVTRITNIIQNTPKNRVTEELQKWVEADPRIKLAEECLNPILNEFFLEVDDREKGKVPITLRTKQGIKIDSSYLSTGTRQLLATAIPLYKFDTKDTVILFDEPERSLFPDIQRILIDYYTKLAPEAQFFFATHSPIIASAFEPCERFILYFDENGEVKCRNGVAPEGDDPNDVLRQDFGMSPLMLDKGVEAYQGYLDLGTKILNEKDTDRKMELIAERSVIGNKYNFSVTTSNETN